MIVNLMKALRRASKTPSVRQNENSQTGKDRRFFHARMPDTVAQNMKLILFMCLLMSPSHAMAAWVEYSSGANGDVFFFDDDRVERDGNHIRVWNRVRYKTSLMGAFSYQSFLKIDCSGFSQITLQSTFYSDSNWKIPAMATNTWESPEKPINADSALARLVNRLCKK